MSNQRQHSEREEITSSHGETENKVNTTVQMLTVNISAMRIAIVLNNMEMAVEILNEMEKTVAELKKQTNRSN